MALGWKKRFLVGQLFLVTAVAKDVLLKDRPAGQQGKLRVTVTNAAGCAACGAASTVIADRTPISARTDVQGTSDMAMALTGKVSPYKVGFGPFPAGARPTPATDPTVPFDPMTLASQLQAIWGGR